MTVFFPRTAPLDSAPPSPDSAASMTTKTFPLSPTSPAYGWLVATARMEGSFRIAGHVSKRNRPQGCFPMTD
jgi:hypothetical protein